jgi:DNA repair protein RadC
MEFNDLTVTIKKFTIQHALDIYEIMQTLLQRETKIDIKTKEHFWTIALNRANKIVNIELVSMGSISAVVVKPAEVLSIPLQKKASGIILVHNHPSGNLIPSETDKDLTDKLIQACRLMDTPVLDHVIITEHSYHSFKESGLLQHLEMSTKYVPPYELERQFYEDNLKEVELALKEGEKKKQLEMVNKMLLKNKPVEEIVEFTGLSIEEIEEIKLIEELKKP